MISETSKILDSNIKITSTTVRVPVSTAHSESLNIETEKPFEVDKIKNLMADFPRIVLEDEPEKNIYPLALNAAGKDAIYVGRIRRNSLQKTPSTCGVFQTILRKVAALNTVQIARELISRDLVKVK